VQTTPVEYTYTASNTGGSVSFKQNITVIAAAPSNLAYDGRMHNCTWTWTLGRHYYEKATMSGTGGGATVRFTVSPDLPHGVSFDTRNGAITADPTVLATDFKNYTVTATDSGGSTSILVTIRIIAQPPVLKYSPSSYTLIHTKYQSGIDALNTAGNYAVITHCEVSPNLPKGLNLNGATCGVTGIPQTIM